MKENIDIEKIASDCLSCPKPRCESGCPVGNHIRDFIKAIKNGKLEEAADTLYSQNPYPELTCRLCDFSRNCMGHCVKSIKGEGIPCYLIERYISDNVKRNNVVKDPNGRRIAIIGGGISGCTAAKTLAMEGYHVEIFEKEHQVGGAIYTGIPDYRFDKSVLADVQQELLDLGVIIHFGVTIGRDVTIDNILFRFDRVLLAVGAEAENKGGFDAKAGFVGGLTLLYDLNIEGKKEEYAQKYHHAVVWGGGNVAMDCARSLIRIIDDVTIVYRRSRHEMPASADEVDAAEKEGVKIAYLTNVKFLETNENDVVNGIRCVKMGLGELDESGRASVHELEATDFNLDCDLFVPAIGEKVDLTELKPGLKPTEGRSVSEAKMLRCGDAYLGPKTVAHCIHDGKEAAYAIISSFRR